LKEKESKMKAKTNQTKDKARLIAIVIVSLFVILTGALFSVNVFMKGEIASGILGIIIALSILFLALFVFNRGNRDLKEGYPIHDERSRKVIEKASSKAFYVSLYLLLIIGFCSERTIKFRDVSQATSVAVGGMALLFLIFWIYYNKKEI
jgi:uncharacterized membrane protein